MSTHDLVNFSSSLDYVKLTQNLYGEQIYSCMKEFKAIDKYCVQGDLSKEYLPLIILVLWMLYVIFVFGKMKDKHWSDWLIVLGITVPIALLNAIIIARWIA